VSAPHFPTTADAAEGPPPGPPVGAPDAPTTPRLEAIISRVLRAGVALSVTLLVLGLVVALVQGPLADRDPGALDHLLDVDGEGDRTPAAVWDGVRHGQATGLLTAGLLVLVLTPLVRVVASLGHYARARDRTYLAFTVVVLVLLGVSALVGAG